MTIVNAIRIKSRLIKNLFILVYEQKIKKHNIENRLYTFVIDLTTTNIQNIILNIVLRCYVFYDLGQAYEEQTAAVNIV